MIAICSGKHSFLEYTSTFERKVQGRARCPARSPREKQISELQVATRCREKMSVPSEHTRRRERIPSQISKQAIDGENLLYSGDRMHFILGF